MNIIGNADPWADLFPDHLIPDILELVLATWKSFKKPKPADHEVPISRRFREALRREKNRNELPFSIWPESSETDPDTGKEIGRIDICFLHGWREDVYFAFECKRLRIPFGPKVRTNTGEYVGTDGMMCFISGKYAGGLVSGGMIAYIMDGNLSKSIASVKNAIEKKRTRLGLAPSSGVSPCSFMPNVISVKETRHELGQKIFMLYHVFLPV